MSKNLDNITMDELMPDLDGLFADDVEVNLVAEGATEVSKEMEEAKQYESDDRKHS